MGFLKNVFGGGAAKADAESPTPPTTGQPSTPEAVPQPPTATAPPTVAREPAPPEPPRPEAAPKPPAPPKPQRAQETRKQQQEDEDMEGVQRLVSRKVERVLEQLGTLATRARSGEEVPTITVTLHLAHGHSMTGEVVDYVPRESVLMALGKEGLRRSESVAYVDLSTVVAVAVGNAEKLLELTQLVRPNPTRQDVVTLLEKLPHALTEQFWPGEASLGGKPLRFEVDWVGLDDEPGRRALESAVNVTSHALRALAQEQGREVLRRITTVRFLKGRDTRAAVEGETGTVTVGPGEPTVSAFRKAFAAGIR
ncbi:hypothetical protein BHS09_05645 [Myxococcus xanthus]|uniref:Uncharacterized protein n=1 Tax=Myxococcus xanthus TaxID=34 RepID=A0AAE6FWR3_MYXXA|nr:hypothetical protein [Myxococcus xanthus]QDE66529.1 hypothetical protein BHS09_05645 [Myxococcus xanthus]QDE73802.1 hypothetical protein BHS08_05650 [Myxococcus xanthus]